MHPKSKSIKKGRIQTLNVVLEYLVSPKKAEKKPWEMFLIGALLPSVAILLSLWVFKNYVSFNMIALTTLAAIPLMYNTIRLEEKKDTVIKGERARLKEHSKFLLFYLFFFMGSVVAFAAWYVYIPPSLTENVFGLQENTIKHFDENMGEGGVGNYLSATTYAGKIFFNNFKILAFCLIFSLFFGAGAIYILTLNASVIGTAVGMFMKENAHGVFAGISIGLMRYLTHGIFEIIAYFIAGLAGGIISIAVIKHDFKGKTMNAIWQDATNLVLLALLFLFLGALVEVYVTPLYY